MQAHQIKPARGSTHPRKRVGRGNASGTGTYSGRGLKGQKARAGNKPRRFFEGGQTRLLRRLPRAKGFHNPFRVEYQPVNLSQLNTFDPGTDVTPELLQQKRVLRNLNKPVKILAAGEIDRPLTVTANRFSTAAREKIKAAGGAVIELDAPQEEIQEQTPSPAPKARRAKTSTPAPEGAPAPAAGEPSAPAEPPAEKDKAETADGDGS